LRIFLRVFDLSLLPLLTLVLVMTAERGSAWLRARVG
jgi:hypothetical protein